MRTTILYSFLLGLACCAGGCGQNADQRVPVAGRVLIDGQPLTGGTIRFVPEAGRPASSAIMADGSFDLASESVQRASEAGVPPGSYRVQVSASKIVDDETIHWNAPEKYADFRTSGLSVTIDKPTDDLVIELSWEDAGATDESDGSAGGKDPPESKAAESLPSADRAPPSRPEDAP